MFSNRRAYLKSTYKKKNRYFSDLANCLSSLFSENQILPTNRAFRNRRFSDSICQLVKVLSWGTHRLSPKQLCVLYRPLKGRRPHRNNVSFENTSRCNRPLSSMTAFFCTLGNTATLNLDF